MTFRSTRSIEFALALALFGSALTLDSAAAGRFLVIGCSEAQDARGEGAAQRKVHALRSAGFERSHVVDSGDFPKLDVDHWVCIIDSASTNSAAEVVAKRARSAGFKTYVGRGW